MIKDLVIKAYSYAEQKHEGQFRKFSDLPYFSHPKYVARIIEQITNDPIMVAAALLHDVVEDTDATIEEIKELFGATVANYVDELTSRKKKNEDKRVYLAHKMEHMSQEALLIKLADRYHNILFLENDKVESNFIIKYSKETSYIINHISRNRIAHFTKEQRSLVDAIMDIIKLFQIRLNF